MLLQVRLKQLVLLMGLLFSISAVSAFDVADTVSKNISRTISTDISRQLNLKLFPATLKVKNQIDHINHIAISHDKKYLSVLLDGSNVRLWNLEVGNQQASYSLRHRHSVIAVPVADSVFTGTVSGELELLSLLEKAQKNTTTHQAKIIQLDVSGDNKTLVSVDQNGLLAIWDRKSLVQPIKTVEIQRGILNIDFHDGGQSIIIENHDHAILSFNTRTGELDEICKSGLKKTSVLLKYIPGDKLLSADRSGNITVCSLTGERVQWTDQLLGQGPFHYSLDTQAQELLFADQQGTIYSKKLFSDARPRVIYTLDQSIQGMFTNQSGNRLLVALADGTVRVIDTDKRKELLRIIMTQNGWSVVDLHGRYDASPIASTEVVWHVADQEIAIEKLYDRFYEPGLLGSYFGQHGQPLLEVPATIPDGIGLPPLVELNFPDGMPISTQVTTLLVTTTNQGSGIEGIDLYHNGKLVSSEAVLLTENVERNGKHLRIVAYRVAPTIGINGFKVVAKGLWNVEGHSQRITFNVKGDHKKPTAHLIAVGINQYSDPRLNLDYSVPDASSIIDALTQNNNIKRAGYDWVVHKLFDSQASRLSLIKTLEALQETSKEDIVILYLAGHGLIIDRSWYFLPYDTKYQSSLNAFKRYGLSIDLIQDILVKSNAQRILMLVDSCNSGAGIDAFREQALFQNKYLYNFGRLTGITVVAATRRDQLASEMQALGHGIFTYAVLEGLNGKADQAPRDAVITAHELSGFTTSMVPMLAAKHLDYMQQPVAYALGADFILK